MNKKTIKLLILVASAYGCNLTAGIFVQNTSGEALLVTITPEMASSGGACMANGFMLEAGESKNAHIGSACGNLTVKVEGQASRYEETVANVPAEGDTTLLLGANNVSMQAGIPAGYVAPTRIAPRRGNGAKATTKRRY